MNFDQIVDELSKKDPKALQGVAAYGKTVEDLFLKLTDRYGSEDPAVILASLMVSILSINMTVETALAERENFFL